MKRLLYVSESYIAEVDASSTVGKIVADSHVKNARLDITGALLFTGTYFAHIIEGPRGSVEELMVSIGNDPRHGNILVVERTPITSRRFKELKLAYSGRSQFVAREIISSFQHTTAWERKRSSESLTELAYEFLRHNISSISPTLMPPPTRGR
jgi:hypothetical protein